MNRRGIAIAAVIALLFPIQAYAENDPFPGLNYGDKIPGYDVWDYSSKSWEEFTETDEYKALVCPEGSQLGGVRGYRWDIGRYNRAYCWKNVRSAEELAAQAAEEEYQRAIEEARQAAEEESRRWNEANPGKQKCVQWGPIRHPNGVGEASGGVCANPVPAGSAPSGSETVDAPSVGEGDIGSGSSGGSGGSSGDSDSGSSTPTADSSASSTVSSSVSAPVNSGSDRDPTPPAATVNYRGSGYPFTVIVEGSVGKAGCPSGFQEANGLIVDTSTGKRYTECWPTRAWTAYRLGGEAWELYKATGGSYDPTVEVERRSKVELLKAKAKEVSEAAAKETPGIERCSSWSGFGESGKECAYAFIAPSEDSASSPSSSSTTSSPSVEVRTVTASAEVEESPSASESSPSTESSTVSSSIAVGLDTVEVSGNSIEVAKTALAITPDEQEASSISALAAGFTEVPTTQRTLLREFPRDPTLTYRVTSLTRDVCLASSWRVRIMNPGLCLVNINVTDSFGNNYDIVKRMRRWF